MERAQRQFLWPLSLQRGPTHLVGVVGTLRRNLCLVQCCSNVFIWRGNSTDYLSVKFHSMLPIHFKSVPLEKSYRLMNHGPTVLVSAQHDGAENVMAAAWACVLDFGQTPKVTVVLDKSTRTRDLVEASGFFALQLPTKAMATLTYGVGSDSAKDVPDKLAKHGVTTFKALGTDIPLVEG